MVGKESYEADAGGIGFLFPFRYLSCHMKIKSHVYLLGVGQQDKESHQISGLLDTLMMTDYKGHVIKMSSDMANVSQCTSNDSVLLAVSYEIKADNRKLAAESSKTVTQSETKSLLP